MIEEILPPQVVCVDTTSDHHTDLFPQEEFAMVGAAEKRRQEFTTARWCVRAALRRLDLPPAPVVPQLRGEPGWPPSVVGSITHCAGYRAAALARRRDILTVGIDAEPNQPLPPGVLEAISLPEERRENERLGGYDGVCWDRLLFSIKESVYKSWYPMSHRFLDFTAAAVRIEPRQGTFHARLVSASVRAGGTTITGFAGRWLLRDGLLLTAVGLVNKAALTVVREA